MRIHWVQEGIAGETISASRFGKTRAVVRPTIATNDVTTSVSKIRIVDSELRVIENIESFRSEFERARFSHREVLQQAHVEV
jgi:hypothetical protein